MRTKIPMITCHGISFLVHSTDNEPAIPLILIRHAVRPSSPVDVVVVVVVVIVIIETAHPLNEKRTDPINLVQAHTLLSHKTQYPTSSSISPTPCPQPRRRPPIIIHHHPNRTTR